MASDCAEATQNYGSTSNLEAGSACGLFSSGNSLWLTAGLIIADVVGAGILSLPVAVAQVGWLLGAVLICLLLAMNVHIAILMWRVHQEFPNVHSYMAMVNMAFSRAPENQRHGMSLLAGAGQYSFIFAMLGLYILSAGKALGDIFYSVYVCLPSWTLLSCCIILPFHATSRRLGTWQSLICANVATICGTCLIPLAYMMYQGVNITRSQDGTFVPVAAFSLTSAFSSLSTLTFAFTSQFMIIEIMSEMKDSSQFPKACLTIAAPFQLFSFLLVGLGGYYFVGDKVSGMIVDNIPFGFVYQAAAVCLLIHMGITYMMKSIVLCRAVHSLTEKAADADDSRAAWTTWALLCVMTAAISWLIASIVPFFNELVDLIGASVTPICCYIIPIIAYLRWAADFRSKDNPLGLIEGSILILELILAVMLFVFGTYFSVRAIIDHWDTYGPPFSCHCQDMWNTCECSPTHAGMTCAEPEIAMQVYAKDMVDGNFAWIMYPRKHSL